MIPPHPRSSTRASFRAVLLMLLLLGPRAATHGQERPRLRAGDRVRVTPRVTVGRAVVTGTLLYLGPDTVSIIPRRRVVPFRVALIDLERLEVNRGRPAVLLYGAPVLGAALGAWFGATQLGPGASCGVVDAQESECAWETSATLVGAGGGAILFALAIDLMVPEVWRQIVLEPGRLTMTLTGLEWWAAELRLRL